jgi:hypothetical protein
VWKFQNILEEKKKERKREGRIPNDSSICDSTIIMGSRRINGSASLQLLLLISSLLPHFIDSARKFKHFITNDPYSNQRKVDVILYSVFGAIILVIVCYFGKRYCGRNFCRNELAHTLESDDMRYHPISFSEEVSNFMNDSYDKIQAKIMTQVGRNNINLGQYFNHFTSNDSNNNEQPKTKRQLAKAIIDELDEEKGLNFRGKKQQQNDEISTERSAMVPRLTLGNVNSTNNSAASSPYSTARTHNNIDDIIKPTIVLKKGGSKNNIPITVEPPMEIKRKHSLKQAADKSDDVAVAQQPPQETTKQGWDAWNDYFKDNEVAGNKEKVDSDNESQASSVVDTRFESKRTSNIKFRGNEVDNDKVLQKQLNDFNKMFSSAPSRESAVAFNPMAPSSNNPSSNNPSSNNPTSNNPTSNNPTGNSAVNIAAPMMPKEISMRPGAASKLKPLENVPVAPVISPDQKHQEVEQPKKVEILQETLPVLPTIPTFTQISKNQFISERNSPEQRSSSPSSSPFKEPLKLALQDDSDDDSYNIDIMAPSFEVVSASQLLHSAKSEKTMAISPVKAQTASPTIASPPVIAMKGISKDNFISTRTHISPPQNDFVPSITAPSAIKPLSIQANSVESPNEVKVSPSKIAPSPGKPLPPKDLPPGINFNGSAPSPNEFISGVKAPVGPPPKDLLPMAIDGYTPSKPVAPGYLPGKPLPPRIAPPPEAFKEPPIVTASKGFNKPREVERSVSPIKFAGNAAVASLLVAAPTTAPPPASNSKVTTPSKPAPPPVITGRRPPAPFGPPTDI